MTAPGANPSTRLPQPANRRASWLPSLGVASHPPLGLGSARRIPPARRLRPGSPERGESKFARKREGEQGHTHQHRRRRVTARGGATSRLNQCGAGTPLTNRRRRLFRRDQSEGGTWAWLQAPPPRAPRARDLRAPLSPQGALGGPRPQRPRLSSARRTGWVCSTSPPIWPLGVGSSPAHSSP